MTTPRIVCRAFYEADLELPTLGARCAVVSIGEPDTPTPTGFQPKNPLHLRLEFHDVIEDDQALAAGMRGASRADVEALIARAKMLRAARLVYCHCAAGISRSTAVAYILRCLWSKPGDEAQSLADVVEERPGAKPNERLVRLADEVMGRGGEMVRALEM